MASQTCTAHTKKCKLNSGPQGCGKGSSEAQSKAGDNGPSASSTGGRLQGQLFWLQSMWQMQDSNLQRGLR